MRKVWYYASCTILVAFGTLYLVGSYIKDGLGPILLALLLIGAIIGFVNGKSDE